MTRQRLYNPAQLTPEELKASFVARKDTLAEMLRLIHEQTPGHPCQHMMLIGPRGMGKTTLGLRLLHEILETPELAADWQPVAFHEESYGIGDLADFWLAALRHLTRATGDPRWADRAEALPKDEKDTDRQAAYALASLMDFCQTSGKRLLLFVENLDTVLEQLGDERQIHALRASLIERTEILLIGSANTVFEAIRSHGEPLYEFFRLFILKGLGSEETRQILAALADGEGKPEVMGALDREHGRLETIRRLTGGNPRLLVLACRILIDSPLSSAFEDLERLIDEQTPYFKARIEELPVQARKVFHCLADGWKPMQSKEVAEAAKLSSSHASAQLRQLMEKGYAREVTLPNAKRTLYEVSDRFYNIYYLLRFSRATRDRLERLVAFLHELFGATAMQTMYAATLETLRTQGSRAADKYALLGVLANYVAQNRDYKGRENWLRQALDLANHVVGPNAPVIEEIREAFAGPYPSASGRFAELMDRGRTLFETGRFREAEAVYRGAIEERSNDVSAWTMLGQTLMRTGRFEDAITAFDNVLDGARPDDALASRLVATKALGAKSFALLRLKKYQAVVAIIERFRERVGPNEPAILRSTAAFLCNIIGSSLIILNRHEDAITAWDMSAEYVRVGDPLDLRRMAVESLFAKGDCLADQDRYEQGMETWERIAEYVRTDDPPDLRHIAAKALGTKGDAFAKLERYEHAMRTWERVADYVHTDDSPDLRHTAVRALMGKGNTLLHMKRYDELDAAWLFVSDYVHPDDSMDRRQMVATVLASVGDLSNLLGKSTEGERACKRATQLSPEYAESWRVLAEAILCQDDASRVPEAEDCARRAAELAPDSSATLHTLSDVLAGRGNWTEALDVLERSLRAGRSDNQNQVWPGLTESLIQAVAAGYGLWVKRMMEDFGLIEPLEPLWHAVRVEMGEALEPLPAEIMEVVNDIRQEFLTKDAEFETPIRIHAKNAS